MRSFLIAVLIGYCFLIISVGAWENMKARDENPIREISMRVNVPNTVTAVYLQVRVYDTLFEIVLFTLVGISVTLMLKSEPVHEQQEQTIITSATVYGSLVAVLSVTAFSYVVLNGHLTPGGGFAGGVILASGIALYGITSGFMRVYKHYQWLRFGFLEGLTFFIIVFIMTLGSLIPGALEKLNQGQVYGALFSGGVIPLLNILVGIKVYAASWKMAAEFITRRGPL